MSDSLIAQAPFKHDVPAVDFSHLIAQTWQKPMEESPKWAQIGRTQEIKDGVLEMGNWQDLYGIKGDLPKAPHQHAEAQEKTEHHQHHKKDSAELTVKNGGASKEYAEEVRHGLDSLPPHVRAELAKHHVEITVYKNMQEFMKANPDYKGELNDAGSLTFTGDPKHLRIAVFQQTPDGLPVKDFGYSAAGLLRHEAGHMYNRVEGQFPLAEFIGLKNKELNKLTPEERIVYLAIIGHVKHGYYANDQELYAELFAIANGGGSDKKADAILRHYFKDTIDQMHKDLTHSKH